MERFWNPFGFISVISANVPTQSILEGGGKNLEVVAGIISGSESHLTFSNFLTPLGVRPEATTLVWVKPATNQNAFVLLIDIQWCTDISSTSAGAAS